MYLCVCVCVFYPCVYISVFTDFNFLQFQEKKFYLYALYNKNKPKSDSLMSEYGTSFFKVKNDGLLKCTIRKFCSNSNISETNKSSSSVVIYVSKYLETGADGNSFKYM